MATREYKRTLYAGTGEGVDGVNSTPELQRVITASGIIVESSFLSVCSNPWTQVT